MEDLLAGVTAEVGGDGHIARQARRPRDGARPRARGRGGSRASPREGGCLLRPGTLQCAVLVVERGERERRLGQGPAAWLSAAGTRRRVRSRDRRRGRRPRREKRREGACGAADDVGGAFATRARTSASKPVAGLGRAAAIRRTAARRFSRALSSARHAGAPVEVLEDLVREVDGQLSGEVRVQPPAHLRAGVVPDVQGGVHGVPPWAAAPPATIVAAAAVPRTFSRSAARARDRRDMTVPIGTRRMVAISL